jgi:hypothetical protein
MSVYAHVSPAFDSLELPGRSSRDYLHRNMEKKQNMDGKSL